MFDLFSAAISNGDVIESDFNNNLSSLSNSAAELLTDFSLWVKSNALISINTKLFVVAEMLIGRRYQNIYEWADEQSQLSGRSPVALLQERLGPYYAKRMALDAQLGHGTSLKYGALNAGGLGLADFDPYCVVLSESFLKNLKQAACLPGDSLEVCFTSSGDLDLSSVVERIAAPSGWHLLVANERMTKVFDVDSSAWPDLVLGDGQYFEVIFVGDITTEDIILIRLSEREYLSNWDLAFHNLGMKRTEAERALIGDFLELRRAEVAGRLKLEVLN